MMMLIYSMWQDIWILLFATKINKLTIIGMKMNHLIIILEIRILWLTLS